MAAYDFRCRVCDTRFEVRRPLSVGAEPAPCPQGHDDVARIWTAVSVGGRAATGSPAAAAPSAPGGGCCGGGCCS